MARRQLCALPPRRRASQQYGPVPDIWRECAGAVRCAEAAGCAAGRGSGDREFDIVPGEPDRSIVTYRVESTVPGVMMPELGRHIADPDAVKLLADWIASLR